MKGSTYRRCYCRDTASGKPLGKACPQLSSRKHGTYSIRQELPPREDGGRRSFNRAGYTTAKAAQADLDHVRQLLDIPDSDDTQGLAVIAAMLEAVAESKAPLPEIDDTRRRYNTGQELTGGTTVGDWLDTWISGKHGRQSAIARDESIVRVHLKPRIGSLRLDRLRVPHLTSMFEDIAAGNVEIAESNAARRKAVAELATIPWKGSAERARRKALKADIAAMPPFRRITGPSTRRRIRSALRAALNKAIAQRLIDFNPAAHVELDAGRRPKALMWTAERIAHWERTGEKPSPVMVWTPAQTGAFLDYAQDDRLYALVHLVAFRGLRRGEACGQLWTDVDLDGYTLAVAKQLVVDGWEVYEDDPKTDSGVRTIALDDDTVAVLRAHRARQDVERAEWGDAWTETGRVFTREDGTWLHPATVTRWFMDLVEESGLPPIRLHDLRHGAATIAHAAGADLKDIQELLGHSSITITADTYTSLLPETDRALAEAAARLVPRAGRRPGEVRETLAHASLTQTAPYTVYEADGATPEGG